MARQLRDNEVIVSRKRRSVKEGIYVRTSMKKEIIGVYAFPLTDRE